MKLRNIKASFILKEKVCLEEKIKSHIIKHEDFIFTIYHRSPFLINVTGVKCFEDLKLARQIIEYKVKQKVMKVRIDNTFFSQKNYRNVDLTQVYHHMQNKDKFCVDYNVELFAGMFFHPKQKKYPTLLFFRTGSYTIMGGKDITILKECELILKRLIKTFDKVKLK